MGRPCYYCGGWVEFYTDEYGVVRPYGCACSDGGNSGAATYLDVRTVRFDALEWGPIVVTRRVTFAGSCPDCHAEVWWHTNGYGDWVLFDALGRPWEVHECWRLRYPKNRRSALRHACRSISDKGMVRTCEDPALDEALSCAIRDGFTVSMPSSEAAEGQRHVDLPPPSYNRNRIRPRPNDPTSYLLATRIVARIPQEHHPTVRAPVGGVLVGLETESGVVIHLPPRVANSLRTGDAILALVCTVRSGTKHLWAPSWILMPSGKLVDVT